MALGAGWADGAWVDAGWVTGSWEGFGAQVAIGDAWAAGAWIQNGNKSWIRAAAPGGAWSVGGFRILPAAVIRRSAQRVADRAFVNKQSRQTRLPKSEM